MEDESSVKLNLSLVQTNKTTVALFTSNFQLHYKKKAEGRERNNERMVLMYGL